MVPVNFIHISTLFEIFSFSNPLSLPGPFISLWCYQCGSLCAGGLTLHTANDAKKPICPVTLPSLHSTWRGICCQCICCMCARLFTTHNNQVLCSCCGCFCVHILPKTLFKPWHCHCPKPPSWWRQWFIEERFNSRCGCRPTEEKVCFCGEKNGQVASEHCTQKDCACSRRHAF